MNGRRARLSVAVARDTGIPMASMLGMLTAQERRLAESFPAERRRRHFALGRLAARAAVRHLPSPRVRQAAIEILAGGRGQPVVLLDGTRDRACVSVSHSGALGVACAWLAGAGGGYSAGVDVERLRPTGLAENAYAFCARERAWLSGIPHAERALAALGAWTVKEAAWKALEGDLRSGPEGVEVVTSSRGGVAAFDLKARVRHGRRAIALRSRLRIIRGAEGTHLIALVEVTFVHRSLQSGR